MILLTIVYFGVKGFLLWSLPNSQSFLNKNETIEAFDKKDTITIKRAIPIEENYFYYDDFKIRNDFEIFDEEHKVYKVKNTKKKKKNNINTDYKLYEYLFENLNSKLNLFSSINKFRKAHAVDLAAMLVTVGFNKFTLIKGDY